ncbi:MAG: LysR family transcriptional regulator [Ruminococcus sp.]|nr:LysR family transcriptional regulator [Ruminococcus sp.]
MIEIYMLAQLIAIADNGTMSKAAEQLHLSQPALSRTINKLEDIMQVKLFERSKNKIELNENGKLAVEYARKVIKESEDMINQVRAFDESRRTISVTSCAPAPIWLIVPILSELYPNMKVSTQMRYHENFQDELFSGKCQLLITPFPLDDPKVKCFKFFEEKLLLSVPPAHPLAAYPEISLSDLEGETMLLYSDIGFWHNMHKTKTPNTKYILQSEYETMTELVKASALPSFASNVTLKMRQKELRNSNRVSIPIKDSEARATFYCCWNKSDSKKFKALEHYFQKANE